MIIWNLSEERDSAYAEPALRGAWSKGYVCKECTASTEKRTQPLIVEWQPGSDRIADISWASTGCPVITERVHKLLSERFRGYEPGPVEMVQNPRLKRPQRNTKRTKPRVWLPYQGPPLFELWITARVHMDADRTHARLVKACSKCGYKRWELEGYERWENQVKYQDCPDGGRTYTVTSIRHPRAPGKGLFIRADALNSRDIFQAIEFPGWILCTDSVKTFIEAQGFTNVDFVAMGELI